MPDYDKSVFINCPFDKKYKSLYEAMIFTIIACDFTPRCSREFNNADDVRINNIMNLIRDCKYSIHDISRADSRLNMPLELGLFLGCKQYGTQKIKNKSCMILEAENYDSKAYLSDLAGQDFYNHQNKVNKMIESVRTWLAPKSPNAAVIPHSQYLISRYRDFNRNYLPGVLILKNWTKAEMSFNEYVVTIQGWIALNPIF
ncbi:hypothetical protein [Dyadobacter sp. CY356]|uniref:hypothetical protein n=1 Tax=Dyadobacter sp. CY356 TaxID=2906442 RepID=UPI001F1AD402|nr:hypothetical protein [Dyadobacter sp. CY356]MCF0055503.1 hypothetical protein [Dyadobacter sp. CY356]